ncbi:MAG: S16 family serine protease, partial [Propionibacteriaceae bacterium]|nr:S16 family serine protease [Propionibacteriaceae bacterium]
GTGEIDPNGRVSPIGGIQEKIASAENAGADVFLVPAGNCRDVAGMQTDLEIIRVETLDDAIRGLQGLTAEQAMADVPRCA